MAVCFFSFVKTNVEKNASICAIHVANFRTTGSFQEETKQEHDFNPLSPTSNTTDPLLFGLLD